jgi:hypothetical protein
MEFWQIVANWLVTTTENNYCVHVWYHGKFSGIMVTRHSFAKNYILDFQ